MSIKGAQILSFGNNMLIHRLQSMSATVDRAREILRELGNPQTVGDVYENPTVTYEVESFDVSARFEFLIARKAETESGYNSATGYVELSEMFKKLTVISPIKETESGTSALMHVCIPGIELTDVTYTFGGNENASQRFTFRGSENYVCPGKFNLYVDTGNGTTTTFTKTLPSGVSPVQTIDGKYIVYVEVDNKRMIPNVDYTESYNSSTRVISLTFATAPANGASIRWVVPTTETGTYSSSLFLSGTVLPGAIRGKDVLVYIKTPSMNNYAKLPEITSVEIRVTTGTSETYFLGEDFARIDRETPEVSGTLRFKPDVPGNFYTFIRNYILDLSANRTISATDLGAVASLRIALRHPTTQTILKTIEVPTVRISLPGLSGTPTDTFEPELELTSLDGVVRIYKGAAS